MTASTAGNRASRGLQLDAVTASRVGMVRVEGEAAYLDSSSAITYFRRSDWWLTALQHLEEQHAGASEHPRGYHAGKRQRRNHPVNN